MEILGAIAYYAVMIVIIGVGAVIIGTLAKKAPALLVTLIVLGVVIAAATR